MTMIQILGVVVLWALGAAASCFWAMAEGTTALLGFILWTSFFGICNAAGWVFWWSREEWFT